MVQSFPLHFPPGCPDSWPVSAFSEVLAVTVTPEHMGASKEGAEAPISPIDLILRFPVTNVSGFAMFSPTAAVALWETLTRLKASPECLLEGEESGEPQKNIQNIQNIRNNTFLLYLKQKSC